MDFLSLQKIIKSKSLGYGKDNGQNRNGSQHAVIRKGRSIAHEVVFHDAFRYDNASFNHPQLPPFKRRQFLFIDVPDIIQVSHSRIVKIEKDSKLVSRVLLPSPFYGKKTFVIYLQPVLPQASIVLPSSSDGPPSLFDRWFT